MKETGELREGYIAKWKTYPQEELRIRVARPSNLAPSKHLLQIYLNWKKDFLVCNIGTIPKQIIEQEAREFAWKQCDYERRFRDEIANNPEAQSQLQYIVNLLKKGENIRLICYEKEPPCHRFILIDIIKKMQKKG